MVKISTGCIWQRGGVTFIGEFYLSRGQEAFKLCEESHYSTSHHERDIILTRMLEW